MNLAAATVEDLTADPHPILAAARAEGPITWLPALDAWIVTGRDAAVRVMRDPVRFTVDDPRFTTGQILGPSMLSTDGAEHARHRTPFNAWFADRSTLASLTEWMAATATDLVAAIRPDGAAELRAGLAAPLAATTVTHALALDPPGADQLLTWYRIIVEGVQRLTAGDDPGGAPVAYRELAAAIRTTVEADRAAALRLAADALAADEVAANAAVILFGGIETSEGATANALWHLLTHPDALATVRDDRSLVPAAVEESLRLEPAAATIDRYATTDVDSHGAEIRRGDYVIVSLAGANRDPAVFDDPDRFRIDRPNTRSHTTFALGPHACLGIHLARAQTIAAIGAVLDGLPDIELSAEATGPTGLVFRKAADLHAHWTP